MSFLKSFITKSVYAAAETRPTGQEAAALFFYGEAPSVGRITELAVGADVSVANDQGKTRVTVTWPDVHTVITIDTAWQPEVQMPGMKKWTERFPKKVLALPTIQEFIASLDTVKACYGTVTKPALDADNKVVNLFTAMLGGGGGFFFSRNSFYDIDRLRITGYDEDPAWLGTPPAANAG